MFFEFVQRIAAERAVAILRASDPTVIDPALEAVLSAGFRLVEITLTTPLALERLRVWAARGQACIGAGSVLTVEQVRAARECGAQFLVSPVVDVAVIAEAAKLRVPMIPGASTPTELWMAHRSGAPLQKLFPAPAGGPVFVRAVLAPMPFLRILPTNGVDETNAADYLRAGAVAVGFARPLFDPDLMKARRFDQIEERARTLLASVLNPPPEGEGTR